MNKGWTASEQAAEDGVVANMETAKPHCEPRNKWRRWIGLLAILLAGCRAAVNEDGRQVTPTTFETETPSRQEAQATRHAGILLTMQSAAPGPTRTPTPARTRTPRPSPSPEPAEDRVWHQADDLIIYTRDNALCALRPGGEPSYITDGGGLSSVRVSPDAAMIAFVKAVWQQVSPDYEDWWEWYNELWVAGADGADVRRLFTTNGIPGLDDAVISPHIVQWEWIPYTKQIALATGYVTHGVDYTNDLYILDANSGAHAALLTPGNAGGAFYISPDGRKVAMITDEGRTGDGEGDYYPDRVSVINVDGTDWIRNIFYYDVVFTYTESHLYLHLTWDRASRGFWIAVPPHDPVYSGDNTMSVWYIPADGSPAVPILRLEAVEVNVHYSGPTISPDGRYLAYFGRVNGGELGLHIVNLTSGQDVLYYQGEGAFDHWEADARHFIFFGYGIDQTWRSEIGGESEPLVEPEIPTQGCAPPDP